MAKEQVISIDEASFKQIQKDLARLFPTDQQTNAGILKALKKAAAPLRQTLKSLIRSTASKTKAKRQKLGYKTGKLAKSIRIFPSVRNTKSGRPSVFVGPLVRPPKRLRGKMKKMTEKERHAASVKFADEQSGFYFYFLQYGFRPRGGELVPGLNLIEKTNAAAGMTAANLVEREILAMLNKRSMKLFGVPLK